MSNTEIVSTVNTEHPMVDGQQSKSNSTSSIQRKMCNRTSTAYIARLFHYFQFYFILLNILKFFSWHFNFGILKFVFLFLCCFFSSLFLKIFCCIYFSWFLLNFKFYFHLVFIIEHSLVVQLVSKFQVENVLTKTNVCGGHARMVVSALIWNHPGNMNVIVHSVIREWIANWNYWRLVFWHRHVISLLQLLFVLVPWYVSSLFWFLIENSKIDLTIIEKKTF